VGLLVGSLLAIILLTYSSANTFWFEHVIAFLYLLAFFISTKEFKLKGFVVGTIVVGASLIKPQAALIMIPLWLSYPRFNFLITFCAGWG
jgi:hypothetical protein